MLPKNITPEYLLAALQRRFWYVVIPFFLIFMAIIGYCIKAPRIYKATTLILVEPQRVPREYVNPTVSLEMAERLRTITEQIKSRTRLEKIITEQNLYVRLRAERTMTDAVEAFRGDIEISVRGSQARQGSAAFEVSFVGRDPAQVRDVTNTIANLFIDDNLKLRESQATGTTRFLERELERMKEQLREKEEQVRVFKEKHSGQLPEQLQNNYQILTQLQRQLDSINEAIQRTEDRRVMLQTQLARAGSTTLGGGGSSASENSEVNALPMPSGLEGLRQQLETLRTRYTENHPEVVKVKTVIERLEKEQVGEAFGPDAQGTARAPGAAPRRTESQGTDVYATLRLIERDLKVLQEDRKKLFNQINEYRSRIENGPRIEQMFVDVRRGYEQANQNYQSLLQKKLQAELAENMERAQQGEQFRVLDAAKLPDRPFEPKLVKILLLGVMMSLGVGLGSGLLREHLDIAFWSRKELESVLELPVLVIVPFVQTEKDLYRNKMKMVGTISVLLAMGSALLLALFVLWKSSPSLFRL